MSENAIRLAKAIAGAGLASRRGAEEMIRAGRVEVNGQRIDGPAFNVGENDQIRVDGELLAKPALRLWLYHKPAGLVTTARDEKGRRTVFDDLPKALAQVNTVGRLDINSEGLLLLTNNGDLKRRLELPATGWRRKYRVRAYGKASEASIKKLREGVEIDGVQYRPMEIVHDRDQGGNSWYTIGLREGKNREIRRVFETIDLQVNRLIRVSYGPFQLGTMKKGEVSEMRPKALSTLLGGLMPEGVELPDAPLNLEEPVDEMSSASKRNSSLSRRSKKSSSNKPSQARAKNQQRGKKNAR